MGPVFLRPLGCHLSALQEGSDDLYDIFAFADWPAGADGGIGR